MNNVLCLVLTIKDQRNVDSNFKDFSICETGKAIMNSAYFDKGFFYFNKYHDSPEGKC